MTDTEARIPTLEELMAVASTDTGLTDFGVPSFRSGFERFLTSLTEDARLPGSALQPTLAGLRRRLGNRLQIEAWYAAHPELADLSITGPVAITGVPRTGTTALADMMSLDPQFRPLRGWEQAHPCPPPVLGEEENDSRRLETMRNYELMRVNQPELMTMHLWEVDATVEDTDLLGIDGRAQSAVVPVTGYHVWWRENSMVDAYRYHRRVAQLLQSRRPPSAWLFKSPHMSFHLDDFVVAYPDARFVVTHRDPVKAVPSWISFVSSLVAPGTLDVTDLTKFGPHLAAHLAVGTDQMMRARRELDDVRFLDIHHHEFVADPMGTITRVYTWLGLELTPNTQTAMSAWSEKNRSGAHGAHRYTAEQFGLDNATLRSQFKEYTDHFDVRLEE